MYHYNGWKLCCTASAFTNDALSTPWMIHLSRGQQQLLPFLVRLRACDRSFVRACVRAQRGTKKKVRILPPFPPPLKTSPAPIWAMATARKEIIKNYKMPFFLVFWDSRRSRQTLVLNNSVSESYLQADQNIHPLQGLLLTLFTYFFFRLNLTVTIMPRLEGRERAICCLFCRLQAFLFESSCAMSNLYHFKTRVSVLALGAKLFEYLETQRLYLYLFFSFW